VAGVILDVATKIVGPSQKIWAVFPGRERKFLGLFAAEDVICLDFPSIGLTQRVLQNDDLLRQHIAMSLTIQAHLYGGKEPPSRRPTAYPVQRNASISADVGYITHMFSDMQVGDLVLVGRYSYYEPILVGEIKSPFDPDNRVFFERYGKEDLQVRRVRWLNVKYQRRFLPQPLSDLLSNQHAVVSVNKTLYGQIIYKIAYEDFVLEQNSRYVFSGPEYNNIATSTVPAIELISYFAAAFHAYEEEELPEFISLKIPEAIDNYFEGDILNSFEINFSSPGEFVLDAKRATMPLLVAILVFATSGTMSYAEARQATIINSCAPVVAGEADAAQLQELQQKYQALMELMGEKKFEELCAKNKDARDGVGLKTRVKKQPTDK
jgi:hypothetical protein